MENLRRRFDCDLSACQQNPQQKIRFFAGADASAAAEARIEVSAAVEHLSSNGHVGITNQAARMGKKSSLAFPPKVI